jgi:putative protease
MPNLLFYKQRRIKNKMSVELLAPAGNVESLKAAIGYGADAVYLGVKEFNARMKADNFTVENLEEWVSYAHLFKVKVYLALNTSVKENEINKVQEIAKIAKNCKIDALIVADIGLLSCFYSTMPDIVLHSSTQMGIHNLEGVLAAQGLGISRVILSRETTRGDIINIKQNSAVELEVFVHGALCVCFSGGCYMSSFISGNSGNRGLCLQPCRQYYKAYYRQKKINEGYLLSTADLCGLQDIKNMTEDGITAFKIEGRLKRSEYVAAAVKAYRYAIDNDGLYNRHDIDDLKKVYNRGGFTQGYYFNENGGGGDNGSLMSVDIQGHRGLEVGVVTAISGGSGNSSIITARTNALLNENDGFKLIRNGRETGSATVKNGRLAGTPSINVGDVLAITSDGRQLAALNQYKNKLNIKMRFSAKENEKAVLKLEYEGINAVAASADNMARSINIRLTEDTVREQLNKLTDTPFECGEVKVKIDGDIFMTKAKLNELRREAVGKLTKEILSRYVSTANKGDGYNTITGIVYKNSVKNDNKIALSVSKRKQLDKRILDMTDILIFSPDAYTVDGVRDFIAFVDKFNLDKKIYLNLPSFANCNDIKLIKEILDKCKIGGIVANNIYAVEIVKEFKGLKLIGGLGLNIYNSLTAQNIINQNGLFIYSCELTLNEIKDMTDGGFVFVCGDLKSMQLSHCPVKLNFKLKDCKDCDYTDGLIYEDNKGFKFKIRRVKMSKCYFELYNGAVLDTLKKLKNNDINMFFNFINYSKEEIYTIIKAYKRGNGKGGSEVDINASGAGGIKNNTTSGHLIRGVK